jgi:hypothetical protein
LSSARGGLDGSGGGGSGGGAGGGDVVDVWQDSLNNEIPSITPSIVAHLRHNRTPHGCHVLFFFFIFLCVFVVPEDARDISRAVERRRPPAPRRNKTVRSSHRKRRHNTDTNTAAAGAITAWTNTPTSTNTSVAAAAAYTAALAAANSYTDDNAAGRVAATGDTWARRYTDTSDNQAIHVVIDVVVVVAVIVVAADGLRRWDASIVMHTIG